MIVVSMTKCPPKLRGDLSKWLLEINTGVYVGKVSARVREALWQRICENISDGQATMVFSAQNEQHMDFYVHNNKSFMPVDFDGIKLIKHLNKTLFQSDSTSDCSNVSGKLIGKRRRNSVSQNSYVLLFPACAGVILYLVFHTHSLKAFPRVCGGDPPDFSDRSYYRAFSPRVRG